MSEWKIRLRKNRKRSDFRPDSDQIAEATREFLKNGGKIVRLENVECRDKFFFYENDIDFTREGL